MQNSTCVDDASPHVVIIGGGIAGLTAAEELRKLSPQSGITLISEERHLPYYRLSLTRYLAGAIGKAKLIIHPEEWYTARNIRLLQGKTVTNVSPDDKTVLLCDGTRLAYDKLIFATGALPFIPPIPGSQLKNVVTVRTVTDADCILEQIRTPGTCLCIGGGVLGLEIAGAIAKQGIPVQVLEGAPWLMPRQLNQTAGQLLQHYMESVGVQVLTGVQVTAITGQERSEAVLLKDGRILPADLVIIAAGVRPNTALLQAAGIAVRKGLPVNDQMQSTCSDIYAAGDVTEHCDTVYGLWPVAQSQGKTAARNALGLQEDFTPLPASSSLKVLDIDLFSIGDIAPSAGDGQFEHQQDGAYYMFLLRQDRIAGSIVLGDQPAALRIKKAVEQGDIFPADTYPDAAALARHFSAKA